jgi:iron complex outermembrane receptor protein
MAIPFLFPLRLRSTSAAMLAAGLMAGPPGQAQPLGTALTPAAQVVISGTRFSQDAQTLPFGVSVLTAQDIARSGAGTVNEAIARLLGVPVRLDLTGGDNYTLDLRGFGQTSASNQVVVIDGLRLDEGDLSSVRLAGIAIDTVERIEVLRGSGAVLYGEGSTGGVVVVTTRAGAARGLKPAASVQGQVGSFDSHALRASVQAVFEDLAIDLAAQRRRTDNHRDNFAARTDAASVGLQWQAANSRLALRVAAEDLASGLPGPLDWADYQANPRRAASLQDRSSVRSSRTTLLAETRLGLWDLAGDMGLRDKQVRSVFGSFGYDYDVQARQVSLRARRGAQVLGLANSLVVGLDVSDWQRDVAGGGTADQRNRAAYLRNETSLPGGLRLSGGLRRESLRKFDSAGQGQGRWQTAWEIGLLQPLGEAMSAYARLGRSFRTANADEYGFTAGGTALQPQTSRDAELGLRWQAGGSRLEARLYRSALRQEIGYDPTVPNPMPWDAAATGANVNFDPTRRQGLELEAAHALSTTLRLRANLAWRDATFQSGAHAGKQVPLVVRQSTALGADWQFLPQHRLAGNLVHAASSHPDFANACEVPAATTLDLRYAYQPSEVLELSLAVANATDRRYFTQAYACNAGVAGGIYPEPGRSVQAAMRWRY